MPETEDERQQRQFRYDLRVCEVFGDEGRAEWWVYGLATGLAHELNAGGAGLDVPHVGRVAVELFNSRVRRAAEFDFRQYQELRSMWNEHRRPRASETGDSHVNGADNR